MNAIDTIDAKPPRTAATRYRPGLLIDIYCYAKAGFLDAAIARMLQVGVSSFKSWKKTKRDVRDALERGRRESPGKNGFARYFYAQLDPVLQDLWDRLVTNEQAGGGYAYIDRILADHGREARQALFLHALVYSHFSPTRAMERVGIDKRILDDWTANDPDFIELIKDIPYHKGNYFEDHLLGLVEGGDRQAILFANKTYNKDRGYGVSADVNVKVSGSVQHERVLDLSELELSPECQLEIVNAIRRRDEAREDRRRLGSRPSEERVLKQIEAEIVDSIPQDSK